MSKRVTISSTYLEEKSRAEQSMFALDHFTPQTRLSNQLRLLMLCSITSFYSGPLKFDSIPGFPNIHISPFFETFPLVEFRWVVAGKEHRVYILGQIVSTLV